jgi:hypothetical protein
MKILGLTGVARSGKDTFCSLLIEECKKRDIVAKRFALADVLKEQISPFLKDCLNIDIFNCSPEEKELVRPLLVEFGRAKRIQSKGTYWTSLVEEEIFKQFYCIDVAIVTDVRHAEYDFDEVDWLKSHGGSLIHLTRISEAGCPIAAPNADEARNDPKLFELADLKVEWETGEESAKKKFKEIFDQETAWNW